MNRDNFMFMVIGVLAGFLAGYLMHETMAARQPAPQWAGAGIPPGSAPPAPAAAAPNAGNSGGDGAGPMAAMQQVQRLRAHVDDNPEDHQALRQLANLNYDIQNWSRAAELYERYLTMVADNVEVMTDLGACYRNQGQFPQALELFQRARKTQPDHWQARYNEVLVLAFDLKDIAAAQQALEQLRELQPDNPNVERLAQEVAKRANA